MGISIVKSLLKIIAASIFENVITKYEFLGHNDEKLHTGKKIAVKNHR